VKSSCQERVDLGFILDSSGSLRNEYGKEKDFLKALASTFDMGSGASRIGVVTFSYYTKYSVKLKDHSNIHAFSKAVDEIPLMGSTTRIDKALRMAQTELFAPENGGRKGVTRVLILLTDGSQTQDVGAEDPGDIARELRDSGINLLTVGIGKGVNQTELSILAGDASNLYSADSFDELISHQFLDTVNEAGCNEGKS
jgi:Uncharacterized protein containing a von Willebrand factor type A (vWA) domain